MTKILSKNLEGIELRQNINYWKKLKYLNLYSLEGGILNHIVNICEIEIDRHRNIYTWCIIEGLITNFNYEDGKGGIYS